MSDSAGAGGGGGGAALYWQQHPDKEVTEVAWNRHDPTQVASAGGKTLCAWHASAGGERLALVSQLSCTTGPVLQCLFDPRPGNKRLMGVSTGSVRLWDVASGKEIGVVAEVSQPAPRGGGGSGGDVGDTGFLYAAWHPHGNLLVTVLDSNVVNMYDTRKAGVVTQAHEFPPFLNEVQWVDADTFAIARSGGKQGLGLVDFFSAANFQHPKHSVRAHTQSCNALQVFTPPAAATSASRGPMFATGSEDSLVTVWDLNRMLCRGTVDRFDLPIGHVVFSGDGSLLATIPRHASPAPTAATGGGDLASQPQIQRSEKLVDISDVDTLRHVTSLRIPGDAECGCFHPDVRGLFLLGMNHRGNGSNGTGGGAELGLFRVVSGSGAERV